MSVHDFPFTLHDVWRRKEAGRAAKDRAYQRIGFRLPVIELADEPRQPDGTREFCALLDAPPRRPR